MPWRNFLTAEFMKKFYETDVGLVEKSFHAKKQINLPSLLIEHRLVTDTYTDTEP